MFHEKTSADYKVPIWKTSTFTKASANLKMPAVESIFIECGRMLLTLLPIGKPRGISVRFVVNRLIVFRNVFRVRTQATLQSTFATHLAGISPWARRRSASRLIKANNMDLLISLLLPSGYSRACRLSRYLLVYIQH